MAEIRVLVVEDEIIIAEEIKDRVEGLGYQVCGIAANGSDALAQAETSRPDIVLMDIKLPGDLDGIDAAQHIRSRFRIPVIFVTAYADSKTLMRAKKTEPYGYLIKPFETREIYTSIEMALHRHKAEIAMFESEEMYRDLVEKISDVIYAINTEGVITYLSPAAESLLGLPPKKLVGRQFAQSLHPEDSRKAQENVQALLAGGIPGTTEYRVLNALGETRWIGVTSQPIVDGGQVTGFRGVLTDITERKRVEEQLEEAAIAAERQRLARDLHDSVTQTLYSLDLFANAAQEALSKGKIETGTEHAQRIRSLSQSALVDMRLLIFELQPPLLEEGLAGALRARLESVEARAGLTTEFEAMAERPLSPAVESELYAVAREALNNALRHAQADRITVKLDCDERGCCLTIRDDGVGFDLATTERTGGFGLRNMAYRAERIGGSLTLETAPGKGTTVRVEVTA